MEQSVLAEVVLPISVFAVMVVLGLTLSVADFRRLITSPRPAVIGLAAQLIVLPALGFAIASLFSLDPLISVSVVLLASAPGGVSSNVIIHLTGGDRALSITLTALSNLVIWLSVPLFLTWAFSVYVGSSTTIEVPFLETMAQVAAITVIPVAVGMVIRHRNPDFAERTTRAGKIFSAVVLVAIVLGLVVENLDVIVDDGPRFAPALILLNAAALTVGYGLAKASRLDHRQSVTVAVETGIQNGTVAITVALVSLDSSTLAIIPALYGLWMLLTGFGFARFMLRGEPEAVAARAT